MRKSTVRESLAPAPATRARTGGAFQFLDIGNVKDTRNFKDKSVFLAAANEMVAFLEDNNFPNAISVKQLEQPTSSLVASIFKFLMTKISSTYDLTKKLEEEMPQVMMELYYPFPLKKSHVQSGSTPSGWPVVFGALHWLMETNADNYSERIRQRDGKAWREYYAKQYESFLRDKPVAPEVEDDMRRVIADELQEKMVQVKQCTGRVEALASQLNELELADKDLLNMQSKSNEDSAATQVLRQEVELKKSELAQIEQQYNILARRLANIEAEANKLTTSLESLRQAIANQSVDKNVISATREAISKLELEILDAEQDVQHQKLLVQDTQHDILSAKAPVEESLSRFRSCLKLLLSQINRLNIGIDPSCLGMSPPSNPFEQLQFFKNTVKPASVELSDTLNEECVTVKQKLREFMAVHSQLCCEQEHLNRELKFLEEQNQRLLEEERQFVEREERRLYEWKSQEEEQAAKRRAYISELDARNIDLRHRITTIDKEIECESMVLVDKAKTYEQVLLHISNTAAEAYKPVTENMLNVLKAIRDTQKREEELIRRGFETINEHPFLRKCLDEVLSERNRREHLETGKQ